MARTSGSRASDTGPRIRAAALRLFAAEGFEAVSMRRIAAEVGLQVGALYNYTPDKQSLLHDLMRSHMEELLAALDRAVPADGARRPEADLDAFVRFHMRFHADRPEAVFVAYMELRSLDPPNFAEIETLRRSYEMRLGAILERGQEAGTFALEDVEVGTRAVIAMITGLTTWYRPGGRLTLDQIERVYTQLVRGAVSAR